jgi:hypothetical protein
MDLLIRGDVVPVVRCISGSVTPVHGEMPITLSATAAANIEVTFDQTTASVDGASGGGVFQTPYYLVFGRP